MSINCGGYHTVVVPGTITDFSNKIYTWGCNDNGQLGLSDLKNRRVPIKLNLSYPIISVSCGKSHTVALGYGPNSNLKLPNYMCVWGSNMVGQLGLGDFISRYSPEKIYLPEPIQSAKCGAHHTICLVESGIIYSWGSQSTHQLHLKHTNQQCLPQKILLSNVIDINCGMFHTIILTKCESAYQVYVCHVVSEETTPQKIKFEY